MPQVQILPHVPGFGESLIGQLQRTGSELSQAYQQRRSNEALFSMLQNAGGNAGAINPLQLYSLQQTAKGALGEKGAADLVSAVAESGKAAEARESNVRKYTKDYVEKTRNDFESAKLENARLDRLSELNKKELVTPTGAALAEKLDLPIALFGNPNSEEFQKVSQDLLNGIQNTFGSRILQVEVQNFLKTIPTLQNSKEGRDRIIKAKKIFNKAKELNYEAFKDIKKSKGISYDIQDDVIERVAPQLDKLADEFRDVSGQVSAAFGSQAAPGQPSGPQVVNVIAPDGSVRRIPQSQVQAALQAGGRLA